MDKLVDIKGFVDIPDASLYIFLAIVIFTILVLIFLGLKIYRYFSNSKKDLKLISREKLTNLDFKNSKDTAYTISKYAPFLVENDAQKEFLDEFLQSLAIYKYQKTVPEFTKEDMEKLKTFMDLCNV